MRTTVIYSTLTKPELFFGLAKESLVVIAAVTMLFIFFKENFGYSILYLIPILGVVYGLLWWVAKVDPFFFKIMFERIKLKTKGNNKHGGNYYE
ncbi:hypothetical protein BSPLISOX_2843 [uncultured Gammaproteobacteria bacterium]|jgi:type IV secretory pathway VirB3-like protein|nr:hypothetical protein [uncultured Gammaproteobacteria bacterium]VVH54743.1 hypothetical protein BSPCLSOX_451 [uncultured Gammaproteobacteria bacterium]VVH62904.1 hypothetical protein BSPWISOX_2964 [uncultured Gammaproteobacteria bacterium]VVH64441.1 hypothetical protein BSPLISOX_2843 [uncultured Gammaproteobacteria bacterium]